MDSHHSGTADMSTRTGMSGSSSPSGNKFWLGGAWLTNSGLEELGLYVVAQKVCTQYSSGEGAAEVFSTQYSSAKLQTPDRRRSSQRNATIVYVERNDAESRKREKLLFSLLSREYRRIDRVEMRAELKQHYQALC
mmetsp:Transcript_27302/g.44468  ORF Transcript_27302/g.44468 Transcript_27302/m.44468 type:complete len:136 (+) Transcript_27302:2500-2907(+)